MARLIQLHLNEGASASSYADTGSTAGVWLNSASPPTSGATGIEGKGVDMVGDAVRRYIVGEETTPNYDTVEPANATLWAWVFMRTNQGGFPGHIVHKVYRTGSDWNFPWVAMGIEIAAGGTTPDFNITTAGNLNKIFAPSGLSLNQWHLLAQTYDGTTLKGYVDGVLVVSSVLSAPIDYGTHGKWMAGSANDGSGAIEAFNGIVDEINLDSTVFTDQQIFALYNAVFPATPTNRLPIDQFVQGYWGFDEADDSDPAFDESYNGVQLAFNGTPVAVQSRIGNARQFDGSSVYANTPSSTVLNVPGNFSTICWMTINSFNSSGSLLRTIVAYDGSTSGSGDNTQYSLSVDNTGAFIFRHDHGAGLAVVWKTAPGTIQINKFFSVAISRSITAGVATVQLFLNNVLVPWASITDNGSPTVTPPAPTGGSTATFKVGRSDKASDFAYWFGLIDELSIQNTNRLFQPYFVAAYFRVTLAISSSRFTVFNNVKSIGSFEMGGGSRWWTYERDQNLYVVRENSLGFYSTEVQLTIATATAFGAPVPAEASQPELYYDAASDTLLVLFLSANKIWKITANSEDVPSTQNMPVTADTPSILKLQDSTEASRFGGGIGDSFTVTGTDGDGGAMSEINPVAPIIQFINVPSFGVAINNSDAKGYALYRVRGGAGQLIATLTSPFVGDNFFGTYYFEPVSAREFGDQYFARPIRKNGTLGLNYSNVITDWLGRIVPLTPGNINEKINSDGGDISDFGALGGGEANEGALQPFVFFVNHTPVKLNFTDAGPIQVGAGEADSYPLQAFVFYINRTPLKINFSDPDTPSNTLGAGQAEHLQVGGTGRTAVIL